MTHQGRCSDVATIREILRSYQALGAIKATARALSCAKGTVREYVRWAQSEGFLSGDLPDEAHLAGAWEKRRKFKPTLTDALEPLRETLQDWNHQGISLVRMQEMLEERHGWTGGYDALKRYPSPSGIRHPPSCAWKPNPPRKPRWISDTSGLFGTKPKSAYASAGYS